jgi:hypothetical protein
MLVGDQEKSVMEIMSNRNNRAPGELIATGMTTRYRTYVLYEKRRCHIHVLTDIIS